MEEGHSRVLGFSDGRVKVGRTIDPKSRLAEHQTTARQDEARVESAEKQR